MRRLRDVSRTRFAARKGRWRTAEARHRHHRWKMNNNGIPEISRYANDWWLLLDTRYKD